MGAVPRAPAERRRWRLGRLVLCSVPRVRACACAARAPALRASAVCAPAACMPDAPVRRARLSMGYVCAHAWSLMCPRFVAVQGMAARARTDQGVPEGFVLESLGSGAPWLVLYIGEFCQLRPVAQCAPAEMGTGGHGSWPLYGVGDIMMQRSVKSERPHRIVDSAKAGGVRFYPAVDDRAHAAALVDIMGVMWLASHLGIGEPRYLELGGGVCRRRRRWRLCVFSARRGPVGARGHAPGSGSAAPQRGFYVVRPSGGGRADQRGNEGDPAEARSIPGYA